VISSKNGGNTTNYDFAQMQGTLLEDLQARDFTINSAAINLREPLKIHDPLKAGRDLQEKWLRPSSPFCFQNDPVRVIRAVRYAVDLKLKIETGTHNLLSQAVEGLELISVERKRDELFKILDNQNASTAARLMLEFGILTRLGIHCINDEFDHLRMYETLIGIFLPKDFKPKHDFFITAAFISAFSGFKGILASVLFSRNSNGHSRLQLGKFIALNWLNSTVDRKSVSLLESFSNEEINIIQICLNNKETMLTLLNQAEPIDSRSAYRFFKCTGEFGVDLVLLAVAWEARVAAAELDQRKWLSMLTNAAHLIDLWFNHPEVSNPQPLLDGNELMTEVHLDEGPLVGQLLEEMKEEQAAGGIKEHKSAVVWLKNRLAQIKAL
jgi:tRNA nucleotidyltransferase/poly(A) polymerase